MSASAAAATADPETPAANEVAPADVVTMRDGLPGFERCRRFVLSAPSDLAPLVHLQGLDGTRPSFLALDPRRAWPAYETVLSAADRKRLGAEDGDVLLWLALVRIDGARVFVNLHAPVVINPRRMLGLQVVPAESPYDTNHELLAG
jgi:flagellar assembly factor FliW